MITLKFKKLHPLATIPTYATDGSVGLDLTAVSKEKVYHPRDGYLQYINYDTGIAVEISTGYVGLVFPRSSVTNKNLTLGNCVGVIDPDFRNSISFRFRRVNEGSNGEYEIGDRIGQLLIVPCKKPEIIEVEELSVTKRGTGGYGSTGK